MSSVTERDRVYGLLDDNDQSPAASAADSNTRPIPTIQTERWSHLLSTSKLSQTVAYLSLQVAAKLHAESHLPEAYDAYRYALAIFEDHPPGTDIRFAVLE